MADSDASPFSFYSHARQVFFPRFSSSPLSLAFPSLSVFDGYRACLSLWMIAFHSIFFIHPFHPVSSYSSFTSFPLFSPAVLGYLAVDGFFVLTGCLVAATEFIREKKILKNLKENPELAIKQLEQFSLSDFWWRRFSRIFPILAMILSLHCGLFSTGGYLFLKQQIRSENMLWFLNLMIPDEPGISSNCSPGFLAASFLSLNNFLFMGGAFTVSWSLAVQGQFYLFFPLIWKFFIKKYKKQVESGNLQAPRPSEQLVKILPGLLVASSFLKAFSFFHTRSFPIEHPTGTIIHFFWYASTFLRMGVILWGILVAFYSVYPSRLEILKKSRSLQNFLNLACVSIIGCLIWFHVFYDCQAAEMPGDSAIRLSQEAAAPHWNVRVFEGFFSYLPIFLYYLFLQVSGAALSFFFSYLLFISLHSIGWLGCFLQRFFAQPFFGPLSALSMLAYFFHPMIITKLFEELTRAQPEWRLSGPLFIVTFVAIYFLTFTCSFVFHILFERPLDILLRPANSSNRIIAFFKRFNAAFCCFLLIVSLIVHLFVPPLVILLFPRPEGVGADFRRPRY